MTIHVDYLDTVEILLDLLEAPDAQIKYSVLIIIYNLCVAQRKIGRAHV